MVLGAGYQLRVNANMFQHGLQRAHHPSTRTAFRTGRTQSTGPHLHHLIKGLHVLLHAVMRAQVGHKVARIHAVKPVEQRVDAGVQVDEVNFRHVS